MEEKGWITHRVQGRTFLYAAAMPKRESIGQKVCDIVEKICGNSAETLMVALLDYRGLDADELKRIRRLLEQARATRKRGKA
jgi:predicted transcriptional regulator